MLFFTSDRHFLHRNMTKEGSDFCNRGYETVEEMTEDLIFRHNDVVSKEDTVVDCGDISLYNGKPGKIFDIYKRLNGNFIIVRGNHDNQSTINYFKKNNYEYNGKEKFIFHDVGYRFKHNKNIYYCTHYPLDIGDRGRVFNIHGHIHNNESPMKYGTNVGVDSPEYYYGCPVSLDEVIKKLESKL